MHDATAADWLVVAYLGVVQIALAYVLVSAGLRHLTALEGMLLLLLEPVLNPVWAGSSRANGRALVAGRRRHDPRRDDREDRAGPRVDGPQDRAELLIE